MQMYLSLKERAKASRADPEVQESLAAAKVDELGETRLNNGESYDDLLADSSSYEDFDQKASFTGRGGGFVRVQQLPAEDLLGARR
jgi:xylose isomerase